VTRILSAAPIAVVSFVLVLLLAAATVRSGIISDDAVNLWAAAIAAGDGEVTLGRVVAAYPSIPFLATTLLGVVTPAGTPTPVLLSALLVAFIAGLWFVMFRAAGASIAAAVAAVLLIAFHPALLRAAAMGPADMFLVLFLFLLGKGLYDLRAHSAAPEVMTVALALVGLAFSHPIGAAIVIAGVPFLVLAVRPALVANSAVNVVIALVFPVIFCAGAFVYISWVFPGSGWSFLTAPAASLAAWAAGIAGVIGGGITGSLALDTGLAVALALVIGAPAAFATTAWVYRRRPLVAPAMVLAAAAVTAAVLTVASGLFGEPTPVLVAAPVLAAIVMIRVPVVRERMAPMLALLVVGWIGGAAGLVMDPRIAAHVANARGGASGERERLDALNLGHATAGHAGVLVDTFNTPAVVVGRGRAHGLFGPQGEAFALTLLFARLDTPYVAVPDPQSVSGAQDRLNKAFPKIYRAGAPGYRLVYQNSTWRMFERITSPAVSED
jgi:hypothetical protein